MGNSGSFNWRRGLLGAMLWCGIVTLADGLDQPVAGVGWHEAISFILMAGATGMAMGLVWSLGVELPASARRPVLASLLQVPLGLAASIIAVWAVGPLLPCSSGMGRLLVQPHLQDMFWHSVWLNVFYGSVFAGAYHFYRRTRELRRRLAALRLAHDEADMRLREASLRALREQIRPATLLLALRTLQSRYAADQQAGDRLFERLVVFLRAGQASGCAASSLIESYAGLRNCLDAPVLRWHLAGWELAEADPLLAMAPAPPRLLAVLDRIDRCIPHGLTIEIAISAAGQGLMLRIRAELASDAARRDQLAAELRDLGSRVAFETGPDEMFGLVATLPMQGQHAYRSQDIRSYSNEGREHVDHFSANDAGRGVMAVESAREQAGAGAGCRTGAAAQLSGGAG